MIIVAGHILKTPQQNCCIFEKISTRDKRSSSNFQITSTKLLYFSETFRLVIKGEVQIFKSLQQDCFSFRKCQLLIKGVVKIFKSLQQNCYIIQKISDPDNRGSSNFQNTSRKLLYFWENFRLVMKGLVQTLKSLQQNCFILRKF